MELLNRFRYTAEQAYYSQAQWLDVDKPQNNPLFGVIDQKKRWQKSTETKSEVHAPMSTNQVKGFVKFSTEYLLFSDLMAHWGKLQQVGKSWDQHKLDCSCD